MKKFGLLALVLCVALFTFGCPEQPKPKPTVTMPPAAAQPAGEEKPGETAAPAGEKKADAMPAAEKKADEAKPAEEKK